MKMKRVGLFAVALLTSVSLVACNDNDDTEQTVQSDNQVETVQTDNKVATDRTEYGIDVNYDMSDVEVSHLHMSQYELDTWENLNSDVSSHTVYDYTTNSFLILPDDEDLIQLYTYYIESDVLKEDSDMLVEKYSKLGKAIASGDIHKNYNIVILNPYNADKALLVLNGGEIVHNEFQK